MKHSRLYLLLMLGACLQSASAQKKIMVKVVFAPNKAYKNQLINKMDMDIAMNEDSTAQPMHMLMNQDVTCTSKTGAVRADKKIPVTITYDKMAFTSVMAGQETTRDVNPFADLVVHGTTTGDAKITVDTITGSADEATKAAIKGMVNNMQGNIKFPDKEMKIGESFEQDVPMAVPVAQMQIKMKIHSISTLKDIQGTKAIFDIKQDIKMDMDPGGGNNISGNGSGTGTMIFDTEKKMMDRMDNVMYYQLKANMMGMNMNIKCKADQTMKTEVL